MTEATATVAALPYSRTNPFPARMLVNRRLSGPESEKDTRHFELDLTGWGLNFEVGDSVGVYPTNDPDLVDEIIRALGATGDEKVPRLKGEPTSLREALLRDYSVTQPTPKFLKAIAHRADAAPTLHYLLAPDRKQDLQTYLWGMEVIDFLVEHPSVRFTPEEFVGLLSKLQPRLYSVASSLKAFPDQVHLIVDVVRYESNGRDAQRRGLFISRRARRRRARSGFPQQRKTFSSPGKSRHADHHGWARHRYCAVSSVFAGTPGHRREGKKLALLRSAAREMRLRL